MNVIGIPKGLLYYRYGYLWENFLNELNIKYVVSKNSNIEILKSGEKLCIDEACLSLKLFIGHIKELSNKCDYVLIPRIYSIEKNEQVCTNFNCLYDLVRNLFPGLKIIHYNIDVKHGKTEKKAFLKLGKKLNIKKNKVINAYNVAKEKEIKKHIIEYEKQEKKLQSNKIKILLLGHAYNVEDYLIGKNIQKFLINNNIEIINCSMFKNEDINIYSKKISKKVHWTMNKELLANFMYYKNKVNGTIIITSFPCGPDSLTNEMILRKNKNNNILLLTFEDLNSDVALLTRLESFIDMIKGDVFI